MSTGSITPPARDGLEIARDIIEREAIFLEEQRWDEWLDLYAPDCVYWVPTWRRDGTLATSPTSELSLIYYASRAGLEDRLVRIRSADSPAAQPLARTVHLVGNIRLEPSPDDGTADTLCVRASFNTAVFLPRNNMVSRFFGISRFVLRRDEPGWRIARKTVQLQNDYVATYLDVYCL